jgi:hypothetical protein
LDRATFSNIEHQSIEFVEDTLRPWAERLESEANIKLFGRNNRGTLHTVVDLEERKRGDTAARTAYYRDMFDRGVLSVNDIRTREGFNPIGADGDKRFVPLNMQLLENAGEDIQPPKEPVPPAADEPEESTEEPLLSRIQTSSLAIAVDAFRRIVTRADGVKHLHGDSSWVAKHRDYCRSALMPVAMLLAECHGLASVPVLVAVDLMVENPPLDGDPKELAGRLMDCLLVTAAAARKVA